jgi:hypothetical protein
MLEKEIIAVCSQIHTKHINTLCGQNVEFLNVKLGGTNSNQLPLEAQLVLRPISTRNISYLFPPQTSQRYYEN